MVEFNTLELPYYKGTGRQRERGSGAVMQVIGRTVILFLREYVVPPAKRLGADFLHFAIVGGRTLGKQLGGGKQKRSIPTESWKRHSRSRREMFSHYCKLRMRDQNNLRYLPSFIFCSFWESW